MDLNTRRLIEYVCDGNMPMARRAAQAVLANSTTKKDEYFVNQMKARLNKNTLISLPDNLKDILVAEDVSEMQLLQYWPIQQNEEVLRKLTAAKQVSEQLAKIQVRYTPTLLLHGESGTGKTTFARYIAHTLGLPFLYIRFSMLVNSLLGKTQGNIGRVFAFARQEPCVLCIDELDAIGTKRGVNQDTGEMYRVVIALMQELDTLPNECVVIGATNRAELLDPAVTRRFNLRHRMTDLSANEANAFISRYMEVAEEKLGRELSGPTKVEKRMPIAAVSKLCNEAIIEQLTREVDHGTNP